MAAVVSCGFENKFGHPHTETLGRLEKFGTGVFRTDLHGTVSLESTGKSWKFRTTRGPPVKIPNHATVVAQARAQSPVLLDINTATASDLETLPGIGEVKAKAIIADRTQNGPYRAVADVTRVRGIGPGILKKIHPLVTVKPTAGDKSRTTEAP